MKAKKSAADNFYDLSPEQRRSVHLILCERALNNWLLYSRNQGPLEYVESVVGTHQVVDQQLPYDAFTAVLTGQDVHEIEKRYREPISAMQTEDLEFPEAVTFAYYAIYNLFQKYALHSVIDDWLIVNQALASETGSESINLLLMDAIETAKQQPCQP
jgi:hypothetical protein